MTAGTFYFFPAHFLSRLFLCDVDQFLKKSLLNSLQYCLCFMFWLFGRKACGILTPLLGIKPAPPALEGEVFTTGPLGKSLPAHFVSLLEF